MKYKSAGVDIEKGDAFVDRISKFVKRTYNTRVMEGVGGFAALYAMSDDRWLASGTDGVGTKVKLAQALGIHHTIGIDLVAMCVNDVICTGAKPLFFLDYLATSKLDLEVHTEIVRGISDGCMIAETALIGGETAEMPGVYDEGIYDLAGFCVGELNPNEWLSAKRVKPGQHLVGIASSGFHSNGFSLVRRYLNPSSDRHLMEQCLAPTEIYWPLVRDLLLDQRDNVCAIAHITGSGFENIPRMNELLGYKITQLPSETFRPAFMSEMLSRMDLETEEAYRTFNMGIGLVIACDNPDRLQDSIHKLGKKSLRLGQVVDENKGNFFIST